MDIPSDQEIEDILNSLPAPNTSFERASSGIPLLATWQDLSKKEYSKDRWRIEGLIPKEGFTILASIAGEKKTWLAMEMAKSIALGKNFLERPEFRCYQGNVLYIDLEMAESELQRRGKMLELDEVKEGFFILNDDSFDLSSVEDKTRLEILISYHQISVVFVDTLRAAAGGLKEDKAEDVREFFNGFKEYKNKGVAFVWLDHLRKPSHFEGKIPKKEHLLGSQDKTASTEVLLMLRSDDNDEIQVYQRKNRIAKEIKPFKILMRDELDSDFKPVAVKLTYGGLIEENASQKERAKELILEVLFQEGKRARLELIARMSAVKIGERNTSEALRELEQEGKVKMEKEGRKNFYFLPREGEVSDEQQSIF